MKQALIVDLNGTLSGFAEESLDPEAYVLTVTRTLSETLACIAAQDFELVVLEQADQCPSSTWHLVDRIAESCEPRPLIMVHADDADSVFQARARDYGVAVLSTPAGAVAMPEVIGEGASA